MEAIKAQVKLVEFNVEVDAKPIGDLMIELGEQNLALVGGGSGDIIF